jgi:hypothetical protein
MHSNENTTSQNLWDATEAVVRGVVVALKDNIMRE